jgi:hypothetical protein
MFMFLVHSRFAFLKQWAGVLSTLVLALVVFPSIGKSMNLPASSSNGTESGVSAVWIFANLSFTGMHAQATGTMFWRVVSFIFGFPGTLLTLFLVDRGSERAYGIDMPRKTNQ